MTILRFLRGCTRFLEHCPSQGAAPHDLQARRPMPQNTSLHPARRSRFVERFRRRRDRRRRRQSLGNHRVP